jgi:hypothetical protein
MTREGAYRVSGWNSFNNGLNDGGGNDAAQLPAGSSEQVAELLFGALAPARENKHLQIEEFA